jgi:hypothetical protein
MREYSTHIIPCAPIRISTMNTKTFYLLANAPDAWISQAHITELLPVDEVPRLRGTVEASSWLAAKSAFGFVAPWPEGTTRQRS